MEKVLVLNADYTPLNVTSVYKGFMLVSKGKAEVLKASESPIRTYDNVYQRPLIIRLLSYVKFRVFKLKLNRHRIYRRDKYQCAYCGTKKNLTIDHILPKSRGGDNSWTNLITCCTHCNRYKDNKTPEEAGMKLLFRPYEPTIFSDAINPSIQNVWEEFKETFS